MGDSDCTGGDKPQDTILTVPCPGNGQAGLRLSGNPGDAGQDKALAVPQEQWAVFSFLLTQIKE